MKGDFRVTPPSVDVGGAEWDGQTISALSVYLFCIRSTCRPYIIVGSFGAVNRSVRMSVSIPVSTYYRWECMKRGRGGMGQGSTIIEIGNECLEANE